MRIKDLTSDEAQATIFDAWFNVYTESKLMLEYSSPVSELYHYVDLNGLIGIIQNQSLFASDIRFLNDRTEFEYGFNLTTAVAKSLINKDNRAIVNVVIDKLSSYFPNDKYVTCFSKNGDLLQQWRSYAKDGKGVSVGFKFSPHTIDLMPLVKQKNIIYDEKHQRSIIKECVLSTINYFKSKYDDWNDESARTFIAFCIIDTLANYISAFKHPCFAHEQECRFLYEPQNERVDIKFRTNGSLIVPYILLQNSHKYYKDRQAVDNAGALPTMMEHQKRLPISEITIGPSLDYEPVKQGIEVLLKENGYTEYNIKKSKLPYRV